MTGNKTKWIAVGALAVAVIGGSVGIAVAVGAGDDEPLTGSAHEKAAAAALEHTGGGTVIETEDGEDGAAYGVEVRLDDGSVVEVSLDEGFNVIGDEPDDGTSDQGEDGDG